MLDIKLILNVFYEPNNLLKTFIENNTGLYFPINGGSALTKKNSWNELYLHPDNTYDNISDLNLIFNEMTSIYWFWKNYKNMDSLKYVGYNHYRRIFHPLDFVDYDKYDIICAKPIEFKCITVYQQYCIQHKKDDINTLINVLYKFYNITTIANYIELQTFYAPCNMFIMKKELFNEYCEFMFKLLFILKDKIKLDNKDNYQHRALAFLSERLTSFWIYQKMLKDYKIKQINIKYFKNW